MIFLFNVMLIRKFFFFATPDGFFIYELIFM